MSFACEIFIYKKKKESTTQSILLSGLNTSNKQGLRESEEWRLPSLSIQCWFCPFIFSWPAWWGRRRGKMYSSGASPGASAKRREGRLSGRGGSVQALWYP